MPKKTKATIIPTTSGTPNPRPTARICVLLPTCPIYEVSVGKAVFLVGMEALSVSIIEGRVVVMADETELVTESVDWGGSNILDAI